MSLRQSENLPPSSACGLGSCLSNCTYMFCTLYIHVIIIIIITLSYVIYLYIHAVHIFRTLLLYIYAPVRLLSPPCASRPLRVLPLSLYIYIYIYTYIYIYIYTHTPNYIFQTHNYLLLWTSPSGLPPVSVRRFPSFWTQPLENLSIDSVTNGFLSNPAPGENLVSGNLVMETGCSVMRTLAGYRPKTIEIPELCFK